MDEQYKPNYTEEEYGMSYKEHILEMYKLYVEMADRVSQRRMSTNNFFVSANTLLFAAFTLLNKWDKNTLVLVAIIGIVLSGAWYYFLKSYRFLNSGKFKVVQELEKLLPVSPYAFEWEKLGKGKIKKLYWPLSHLETILPFLFGMVYLTMLVYIVVTIKACSV